MGEMIRFRSPCLWRLAHEGHNGLMAVDFLQEGVAALETRSGLVKGLPNRGQEKRKREESRFGSMVFSGF